MNSRSDNYRVLLIEMFGEEIVNSMLKADFSLNPTGLSESAQDIIQAHLKTIEKKYNIDILKTNTEWVFDFPGWVGRLDFTNDNQARELFIIGEDPHLTGDLSSYDLYCAYGMCHKHILENEMLWKIIPYAFGHNNSINIKNNMSCLEKYYATDLCYISPKGKSTIEKNENMDLHKIRKLISKSFILRQIEILKPKYVVCNGSNSYKYLKDEVFTSHNNERKEKFSHKNGRISLYLKAFDASCDVTVVSFPHFTKRHRGFWNRSANESRILLNKLL